MALDIREFPEILREYASYKRTIQGCSEKTVTNKISGRTDFTISEALKIHRNLLPEFDMDYIFFATDTHNA